MEHIENWMRPSEQAPTNLRNITYTNQKSPISKVFGMHNWMRPFGPPFQGYGARVFQKVRNESEGQPSPSLSHPNDTTKLQESI